MIGITGSSGFVGRHLGSRLDDWMALGRVGHIPNKFDGIIDLATYGNMANHDKDQEKIYYANLMRVMEMTKMKHRFGWFICVSTSSVKLPYQTYYSASKKACEDYLRVWSRENDFPVAIIRPFSVTGPGEQASHLIPTLIRHAQYGETMDFVSEPHHDFIDVRDLVSAILTVKDNITDMRGEVFEVGRGESFSNQEVKNLVEFRTGKEIKVNKVDSMREYDTDIWEANREKINLLGWEPKYLLVNTIMDMIPEYEKNNK